MPGKEHWSRPPARDYQFLHCFPDSTRNAQLLPSPFSLLPWYQPPHFTVPSPPPFLPSEHGPGPPGEALMPGSRVADAKSDAFHPQGGCPAGQWE